MKSPCVPMCALWLGTEALHHHRDSMPAARRRDLRDTWAHEPTTENTDFLSFHMNSPTILEIYDMHLLVLPSKPNAKSKSQ